MGKNWAVRRVESAWRRIQRIYVYGRLRMVGWPAWAANWVAMLWPGCWLPELSYRDFKPVAHWLHAQEVADGERRE